MKRLLPLLITGAFIIAFTGCAGVSVVKTDPEPSTSVMVRTNYTGYIMKHVVSMREMRFKNIVPQRYDFSCGSASLATIFKYAYSIKETKEKDIAKEMIEQGDQQKIRQNGFSLLDMKKYAERRGFQANGYKVKAENLVKLKIPVIVLLNTRGYKHFVVLKGIKNERAYFADPAIGNRFVSVEEFVKSWDGVIFVVYKKLEKEIALPLNTQIRAPAENILGTTELGMRGYSRLPGEF